MHSSFSPKICPRGSFSFPPFPVEIISLVRPSDCKKVWLFLFFLYAAMHASCNSKIIAPPPCSIAGIFQKRLLFLSPSFPKKKSLKKCPQKLGPPNTRVSKNWAAYSSVFLRGEENEWEKIAWIFIPFFPLLPSPTQSRWVHPTARMKKCHDWKN